jgi:RNA polymerase sigma factor (sigma-70 family)
MTFERALRAWDRYDGRKATHRTWLLAIARNLLVDHYRATASQQADVGLDEIAPSSLPSAEQSPAGLGLEPELAQALNELPDRDREILALRFAGDLTGPEIAEMTSLTLANVQQVISRSLRRLRAALED